VILADTSVWIEFLRRPDSPDGRALRGILLEDQVVMTGIVLAEILQGTRSREDLERLSDLLGALRFLDADRNTWEAAGRRSHELRRQGLPTPLSDLLIAEIALSNDSLVFSNDSHFERVPGLRRYMADGPLTEERT